LLRPAYKYCYCCCLPPTSIATIAPSYKYCHYCSLLQVLPLLLLRTSIATVAPAYKYCYCCSRLQVLLLLLPPAYKYCYCCCLPPPLPPLVFPLLFFFPPSESFPLGFLSSLAFHHNPFLPYRAKLLKCRCCSDACHRTCLDYYHPHTRTHTCIQAHAHAHTHTHVHSIPQ